MSDENPQSATLLREDLAKILQTTVDKLTPAQYKEAQAYLLKFISLFADNDFKLGRTGVVKQHINTGDNRPIKQHPKRVPAQIGRRKNHR